MQVASYSSMIHGPSCGVARSPRSNTGVSSQPICGPKYAWRGGRPPPFVPSTEGEPIRHARAIRQALPDHLNVNDLHRLLGAGAMAIGTLVLLTKRLSEVVQCGDVQRAVGNRHSELEGLPLVMHVGSTTDAHLVRR